MSGAAAGSASWAGGPFREPAALLRLSRGFSCLFWSMPLFSAAHGMALLSLLEPRWMFAPLLAPYLPLACGLGMLRAAGEPTPRWRRKTDSAALLALATAGLSPFLAWWNLAPLRPYFAANAAAHHVLMLALLAMLNRVAGECARGLEDVPLRREARAGFAMVLWLGGCTAAALGWLFHRAGLLAAGLPTVLARLASLPDEARYLFLLPYAMTAYVMWRAKETGFRRTAFPGS